ncbi:hypothetical protein MUK42_33038 [Musa troglodytarum]|uniref:Uncharacterized protein n=1 Tax=Musa troglodytarum TaxID=320322 RepID=A0A9E7IB59_9LILI|nr:hypothetical protein MUK42_33038 [Musa troglodytarum]
MVVLLVPSGDGAASLHWQSNLAQRVDRLLGSRGRRVAPESLDRFHLVPSRRRTVTSITTGVHRSSDPPRLRSPHRSHRDIVYWGAFTREYVVHQKLYVSYASRDNDSIGCRSRIGMQ